MISVSPMLQVDSTCSVVLEGVTQFIDNDTYCCVIQHDTIDVLPPASLNYTTKLLDTQRHGVLILTAYYNGLLLLQHTTHFSKYHTLATLCLNIILSFIATFHVQGFHISSTSDGCVSVTCVFAIGSTATGCLVVFTDDHYQWTTTVYRDGASTSNTTTVPVDGSYDVTVYDIGSDGAIHNQPAIDYGVVYLMYTTLCKSVPTILMYMYITVIVTDTTATCVITYNDE